MPYPNTVQIIAHRGASRDRLENTLGAFETALAQGADAIELDVHATRDGVVVVHHDPVARLSSGSGLSSGSESLDRLSSDSDPLERPLERPLETPLERPVERAVERAHHAGSSLMTIADETYASLSRFTLANGERIPRLDDVLALATHRATVYVEIKGAAIEEQVVACLRRHPDTDTAVHSFDHRIPLKVGRLAPETPLGLLSASYLLNVGQTLRAAGARDLWQHSSLIDEDLVAEVHAFGGRVIAWTENDFTRAAALVQMRVNAICTDIPGPMRQALAGLGLVSSVVAPREA